MRRELGDGNSDIVKCFMERAGHPHCQVKGGVGNLILTLHSFRMV